MYFLYPETTGVPLEEMDEVFGEGMSLSKVRLLKKTDLFIEERQELLEQEENEADGWFGRRE